MASLPATRHWWPTRLSRVSTLGGRGLHGQLVNELGNRVMRGELMPGTILDPENIAEEFGVSRTVVRECLKVLAAKGLVGARPRFGTFVTERVVWKLLDSDVMGWRASNNPDPRLIMELAEVRVAIEPTAARMAAERRTPAQLDDIRTAWEALSEAYLSEDADRPDHAEADFAFHNAVLSAAGNELMQRLEVLLAPALYARDRLARQHLTSLDFLEMHRAVFIAIEDSDPTAAEARMRVLMDQSLADTTALVSNASDPSSP